ncbi:MAG: CPBP family intramembrane metalloprotease [Clostridia bacterium]|nr:CPBP family intramembrane metalloprotease [Clostridia bacterium]
MNNRNDNEIREAQGARRVFTLLGFACAGLIILNYGLNFAALKLSASLSEKGLLPPGLFEEGTVSRLILVTVVGFFVAIPLAALAVRRLLPASTPTERSGRAGLSAANYELFCIAFTFAFIGSAAGSLFDALLPNAASASGSAGMPRGAAGCAVYFAVIVLVIPAAEEYFFRKIMIDALLPWGDRTAILFSAVFSAFYHGNVTSIFTAFFEGLALGYLYVRTRKLLWPVAVRAGINLIAGFLPAVVITYLADIEQVNSVSLRLAGLMAGFPRTAGELGAFLPELSDALPGILSVNAVDALTGGIAFAGMVLLLSYVSRLRLSPGPRRLEGKEIGWTVFLSPGVLTFFVTSLVTILLSFFSASGAGTGGDPL